MPSSCAATSPEGARRSKPSARRRRSRSANASNAATPLAVSTLDVPSDRGGVRRSGRTPPNTQSARKRSANPRLRDGVQIPVRAAQACACPHGHGGEFGQTASELSVPARIRVQRLPHGVEAVPVRARWVVLDAGGPLLGVRDALRADL